jgi:hypothetical protein
MVGRAVPHLSVVRAVGPLRHALSVSTRGRTSRRTSHTWFRTVWYESRRLSGPRRSSRMRSSACAAPHGRWRAERCVTGRVVFQHVVLHRACLATVCHNERARRALSEGEPWRYRCGAGRSSEHDTQGDISLPGRLLGDDRKTPYPCIAPQRVDVRRDRASARVSEQM